MLKNKTIILGVTGCIAAYKSAEIVRSLKKLGADVWVAMTDEATKLIAPLTFRTLSGNPVITDLFSEDLSKLPVPHISLTQRANLILVAPATANILAKAAGGIADDPLTTMILASKCPVIFAPAMNSNMWEKEATRDNVSKLKLQGHLFIGPETGPLACGDSGIGRFTEVETIVEEVKSLLLPSQDLHDMKIIITAGPTREKIDPVRFLSNRSSGKMGYALAEAAASRGAEVILVSGPTSLVPPAGVELVNVESAEEMRTETTRRFGNADAVIMSAAVADFKPRITGNNKIKKSQNVRSLELDATSDILKDLGSTKKNQIVVGFSLETENLLENSVKKLREKNLDMIVANDISAFDSDSNNVICIYPDGKTEKTGKLSKPEIAQALLDRVLAIRHSKERHVKLSKAFNG